MSRITVLCTIHEETGNCNSSELYKIIRSLKPQVIFEELSVKNFIKFYQQNYRSLETDAVMRYTKTHQVKQVPVDSFELPNAYFEKLELMYKWMIADRSTKESAAWRRLMSLIANLERRLGFNLLNSNLNDELLDTVDWLEGKMLRKTNNETLCNIRLSKLLTTRKREDEMIRNIYNFSKRHPFHHALLLVGSGHRRSIIKKICYAAQRNQTKLEWEMYAG